MKERATRTRFAILGAGAFVVLLAVDVATEGEPIPLGEFLANALETALIVVSATGVPLAIELWRQVKQIREGAHRSDALVEPENVPECRRIQAQT